MKLTLNKAWELCLKQWRKMIKQKKAGSRRRITTLKRIWCKENGFANIAAHCFFCEYDEQYDADCSKCPPTRVDKHFHCQNPEYHWRYNPLKFYAKIRKLNRIRLKK